MNEVDLIREVEKRPILYDKSVSGFNKTKMRDDAWREVQDALQVTESECKKRWRSLRDSFIKLQRTHGGRTRWPYHHAMKFLLPHIDVPAPKSSEVRRENSNSRSQSQQSEDSDDEGPRDPEMFAIDPAKMLYQHSASDDEEQPAKKQRTGSTEEEAACQCNRTDPDELFLLSCAPTLKRLNSKRNAVARLKIQQVLYEAEFGSDELPYVTPGSECGYEANQDGA